MNDGNLRTPRALAVGVCQCGKLITDSPIRVKLNNHIYYACCTNCEGSIRKGISRLEYAKIEKR